MYYILGWTLIISGMVCVVTLFARPIVMRKNVLECEKGLRLNVENKEELLQQFRNLNSFLIKQVYYNQNGDVEVIGNAGKHIFLLENGVVKSAGISVVSERKMYNLAIEEKAMLDFLAKEENPSLPINPYTRYKFGKNLGITRTLSGYIAFISLILWVWYSFIP